MIKDSFDDRTLANMEVALERACALLVQGNDHHEERRYIARSIVRCAKSGDHTLAGLTQAGSRAARALNVRAA